MKTENNILFKKSLSQINIELVHANYVHCSPNWAQKNFLSPRSALGYIMSGEGWFKSGETEFRPTPGQLYLMPEGKLHSYSTVNSENTYKKYYCHFQTVPGSRSLFDRIQLPHAVTPRNPSRVIALFQQLMSLLQSSEFAAQLLVKSLLYELLYSYMDSCGPEDIKPVLTVDHLALSELVQYIESNLHQKITVTGLANRVGYHPNYFFKLFKKSFGISPNQYVLNRRMERAKSMVVSGRFSNSEIAEQLGFSNPQYFSTLFKRDTGFTPQEYKKAFLDHGSS